MPEAAARLVQRALEQSLDIGPRSTGQEVFQRVLQSDLFLSDSVGPFDIHVLLQDELAKSKSAKRLLKDVKETLTPAAELVQKLWPGHDTNQGDDLAVGLISDARLPIVLTESGDGQQGFAELVSLLDYCERLGYSEWMPANEVDTPANRKAEVVRTWDVQLFNIAHPTIADRPAAWVEHGIGYYSLGFVANRALRRGSWGMVPPWLANGLIDELDIAAYGQAYVGQESWSRQTPGWYRAGWSGFVPQGHKPPPPVMGPPANLAVTVSKSGDPWLGFDASKQRHWGELVTDLKTDAPASFARAAESESFLPRDRAAGRCLAHLLLTLGPKQSGSFTSLLDREVTTPRDGMPDSDPLPALFAQALGGVPELDRLEALDSRVLLEEVGRTDLIQLLESHDAQEALTLNDHREQSLWLSRQRYNNTARLVLFQAFMEIEFVQQMAQWEAISTRLDNALGAALSSSKRYPRRDRDVESVMTAFWEGLALDPAQQAADALSSSKSKKRSKRSRR